MSGVVTAARGVSTYGLTLLTQVNEIEHMHAALQGEAYVRACAMRAGRDYCQGLLVPGTTPPASNPRMRVAEELHADLHKREDSSLPTHAIWGWQGPDVRVLAVITVHLSLSLRGV